MKQKIITMLELQDAMNSRVNTAWRQAGNEWYRAIWVEASEMLEHYGWKWWKRQDPDIMQAKLEVVDIVHFALSIRLEQDEKSVLENIAAAIEVEFENPRATSDIRTTIELLAQETLNDKGAHFSVIAGVMRFLDMSFDELYVIYVGKNVLNFFRQDNGYQDGSYVKVWDGREDNEVLAEIMRETDTESANLKEEIYAALSDAYRRAVAA